MENLFANRPFLTTGEDFAELARCRNVRIERIVSSPTPDLGWYDQPQDEWVVLLEGQARLEVAGEVIELGPGDHLLIPAHTPHRVLGTSEEPRCLWLAVHIFLSPDSSPGGGSRSRASSVVMLTSGSARSGR